MIFVTLGEISLTSPKQLQEKVTTPSVSWKYVAFRRIAMAFAMKLTAFLAAVHFHSGSGTGQLPARFSVMLPD